MNNRALVVVGVIVAVVLAVVLIGHHEHQRVERAADTAPAPQNAVKSEWSTAEPTTTPSRVTLKNPEGSR